MHAARRNARQQADHAGRADDAPRPLLLKAAADLVDAGNTAEPVKHRIEASCQVDKDADVQSFQAAGDVDADLWLTPTEILGDPALRLRLAGDADRPFERDALGLAERARRQLPQTVQRVRPVGAASVIAAEPVQRLNYI